MDLSNILKKFPLLQKTATVYLDSTATALKPESVIQKEQEYYESYSSNIHRGIYKIAETATAAYEETRKRTAEFINASSSDEIIFTRGTTESINLVASTYGEEHITEGDSIVVTGMEHHSNFVPWQQLAKKKKATFIIIPVQNGLLECVNEDDSINTEILKKYVTSQTKIVAFTAISNMLGTKNPVKELVKAVKEINPEIIVVIDGAQAAPHTKIDVQDWNADFLALSAHKMFGPTGVGVLCGRKKLLDKMNPYQYGGEMVLEVGMQETTFKEIPYKFEAGTPNIAGVIAFKEAITFVQEIGYETIQQYEKELTEYAIKRLTEEFKEEVAIYGPTNLEQRVGILSFTFGSYHPHDIAQILDESNVAVRAGHHCAMPLHKSLGIPASVRASLSVYNTKEDIDKLIIGLQHVKEVLK